MRFAPIKWHIQLDSGDIIGVWISLENRLYCPVCEGIVKLVYAHPTQMENAGLNLHARSGKHSMGPGIPLQILCEDQRLALFIFHRGVIAKAQPRPKYWVVFQKTNGCLSVHRRSSCVVFLLFIA
jgi:hypothetical protein